MTIVTQTQPPIIVDLEDEKNNNWPQGTRVYVKESKKDYYLDGGIFESSLSHLHYVSSDEETINKTTGFIEKLSSVFTATTGNYTINWYYEITNESNNKGVSARVQLDNSNDLYSFSISRNEAREYASCGGMKKLFLSAGIHSVDIDFKSLSSGTNACIKNTYINIIKL